MADHCIPALLFSDGQWIGPLVLRERERVSRGSGKELWERGEGGGKSLGVS